MPIINILPNGLSAGNPSSTGNPMPEKRKATIGWNYQVSRRLRKWLFSIPVNSLSGFGYSYTLTVRDCPTTSEDWAKIRANFIKRMSRIGMIRTQWLTEWQGRGVPHLHGIIYFDKEVNKSKIIDNWCELTKEFGSKPFAQDSKPIHSVLGWLDYLAKHAARGGYHYQRSPENIPEGWKTTGRMWGYRGTWEVREPMKFLVDDDCYYKFRRIVKKLRFSNVRERFNHVLADASLQDEKTINIPYNHFLKMPHDKITYVLLRSLNKPLFKEFHAVKYSLKNNDKDMSHMLGISDWIDIDQSQRIIAWLGAQGHRIRQE